MKLQVKNGEYYKLEDSKDVILFDSFPEAVKEMKEAIKKGSSEQTKLWRVKKETEGWQMVEVSYKELFEVLVKEG